MATYNELINYLLATDREAAIFSRLNKIAFFIFGIVLLLLLLTFYHNANPTQIRFLKFLSDIESIMGLFGITGSTLATSLYAQVRADELSRRRTNILLRMRWMGSKQIPDSFYEDLLIDSFKDTLK